MKKVLLLGALGIMGLVSAKESTQNSEFIILKKQEQKVSKRYLITIKTICGTTHQTVFDTDFDTYECLDNEWEMYNYEDCGHHSYENPIV